MPTTTGGSLKVYGQEGYCSIPRSCHQGLWASLCSALCTLGVMQSCRLGDHALRSSMLAWPQLCIVGSLLEGHIPCLLGVSYTVTSAEFGCRAHAADVLHTVHCTLYCGGLVSGGFVSGLESPCLLHRCGGA